MPTFFFVFTLSAWWLCTRQAMAGQERTLWQKGSSAIWEATASVAGAASIGFASVIGLVTFLNSYPKITPSRYPSWLPALENGLVAISAWFQDAANKRLISVVYITLIILCVIATILARRHNKEWKPVGTLGKWKQRLTKSVVALQAFTLFTFFSQVPINDHMEKLAQQIRWRYGVAKRAEQEFNTKRLLAEQLKEAAQNPQRRKEDRDDFAKLIDELRPNFRPPTNPTSSSGRPDVPPHSGGPNDFPPGGPFGWHPPSWPQPPAYVLDKIDKGKPLTLDDYRPSPAQARLTTAAKASSDKPAPQKNTEPKGRVSWEDQARASVITQIENTRPPAEGNGGAISKPVLSETTEGMVWPIKTIENWERAQEQVSEQEAKTNKAERLYGQAVQGALEAVCEYIGLQVSADPLVEAWIDLTINNMAERVYGYLFPGEPTGLSRLATHIRRLLSPKESTAEKLADSIRARISASDYDGAEQLIGDLVRNYPNTKAGKLADSLAEESSFQRTERSFNDQTTSWEETIKKCSGYLKAHSSSPRSNKVRQWLSESRHQKALADADARTPRMIVYVRDTCSNSRYFRENTVQDFLVRSEMNRFRYELRNIDTASPAEQLKIQSTGEGTLPIVLFENKAGDVLNSTGGVRALYPNLLLAKMRAVR